MGAGQWPAVSDDRVDFLRDVRPVLAQHCFACHGPDEKQRKADLRLDVREGVADHPDAIVAGNPAQSELIRRIESDDPDFTMPPSTVEDRLTVEEISRLRRWIEQGAPWAGHWAFLPLKQPAVPSVQGQDWIKNPVDAFILARLEQAGLSPSPEADRRTLGRRASLDLIGLPPSPAEVDRFEGDSRPGSWERWVESRMSSPRFGERMALHWLDLARYGDSDGYHDDTPRVMYQFRDYVIGSFNDNKPFDQFTIEQIAGDLLPEGLLEQRIASAFHRLGPTSSEGGADAEEYRVKYVVDRVNTTAKTWLGVTLECAECHDHKYDPFTTREFYQFSAFFDQVPEDVLFRGNDAPPVLATPDADQARALRELDERIAAAERELAQLVDAPDPALDEAQERWELRLAQGEQDEPELGEWRAVGPFLEQPGNQPFDFAYPPEQSVDTAAVYDDGKLAWKAQPDWTDGKPHYLTGDKCATYLYRTIRVDRRQPATFFLGSDDGIKVWLNGRLVHSNILVRVVAPNQDKVPVVLEAGENQVLLKIVNLQGGYGFCFSLSESELDDRLDQAALWARIPRKERSSQQQRSLVRLYRERYVPQAAERAALLAQLLQDKATLERTIPKLRVMADVPDRRPTYILVRGDFRSRGEHVQPGVPVILGSLPAEGRPDRLALARWITSPENPLAARVAANRLWQWIFGRGLVATSGDFGVRGAPPSHPELLEWLAAELTDSGWDVKHVVRLMLTSATYRQSSHGSPEARRIDPENVLWSRALRYRLPAELIRDTTLASAGLLDCRIGGRSVRPYQPADLWREMAYGDQPDKAYVQDHGADLYRRGIYTFWKRSVHYPAFAVSDAPSREVCTAERPVTNTPLAALVALNDLTYFEAARVLAQRVLSEGGPDVCGRLEYAFRRVLSRPPAPREARTMEGLLNQLLDTYAKDPAAARAAASAGEHPRPERTDSVEHAAWTGVCQALLNLDEALTRE
jgi:hypothetical protein